MFSPVGSDSDIQRSTVSSATRAPSIETSICSVPKVRPKTSPSTALYGMMWKTYLPSAGKLCITESPPRVPIGAPSTCSFCDCTRGMRYSVDETSASASPSASRLIWPAARRYPSITVAEGICTSAMLSKLALLVSSGRKVATSMSIPSRSLTAAAYSARLRRWKVLRPGFGSLAAIRSMVVSSSVTIAARSSGSGRGIPEGGIMPARSLRIIFSIVGRRWAASAMSKPSRTRFWMRRLSLWQRTQYRSTISLGPVAAGLSVANDACAAVPGTAAGATGYETGVSRPAMPIPNAPVRRSAMAYLLMLTLA